MVKKKAFGGISHEESQNCDKNGGGREALPLQVESSMYVDVICDLLNQAGSMIGRTANFTRDVLWPIKVYPHFERSTQTLQSRRCVCVCVCSLVPLPCPVIGCQMHLVFILLTRLELHFGILQCWFWGIYSSTVHKQARVKLPNSYVSFVCPQWVNVCTVLQ